MTNFCQLVGYLRLENLQGSTYCSTIIIHTCNKYVLCKLLTLSGQLSNVYKLQTVQVVDSLRESDSNLTYGQICKVITEVNSEIRHGRKSTVSWQYRSGEISCVCTQFSFIA